MRPNRVQMGARSRQHVEKIAEKKDPKIKAKDEGRKCAHLLKYK
jgi:hypothetical protein